MQGGMELLLLPPQPADAPMSESDTQAVLCPVDPRSAASLVAVRTALCQISGDEALPYAPHMTLLYGDLPQQQRQAAAAAAASALEWPRSINVSEVAVAATDGAPNSWEIVSRIKLQ